MFAAGFAVVLFFIIGERQPQTAPRPVDRSDPNAVAETKEGSVIQAKGSARDIRVEFGMQVTYQDGRTKLLDFKASVDNRGGRGYVVTGKEAWVGAERSSYDLKGAVTLTTSDGFNAVTEAATFVEAEGMVRSEGPVRFKRGRMSGSGVGFTYDRQTDRLWLVDQAVIKFAPERDSPGMEITSGAAGHSRAERYLRFERGMRMTREGQVVEADDSTVFLHADRDEPDRIELRGNSRVTGSTGMGSLKAMQARDINLDYGIDGRTLEQALLAAQASIQLARADGSDGQQLSAEWIEMTLAADGAVTNLNSRDNVQVSIPAAGATPPRSIAAPTLTASGQAGAGLTQMLFDGGTEYREVPDKPGAPGRLARARSLKAALNSSGTVEDAEFGGGFQFDEGKLNATSGDARYHVGKGVLTLSSAKGVTPPHVADERVTIDAPSITVSLNPRQITADGRISTTLSAGARRQGQKTAGTALLKETEAIIIVSDKLSFDEQSGKGVYSGKVVLVQGDTSIRAADLTMDDRQGDLLAEGNVSAQLPIGGRKEGNRELPSIAKADSLRYEDAKRLATLDKNAQLDGVQGNLRADRIQMVLEAGSNALARLEAQGSVEVKLDTRAASGKSLQYFPGDQRYVLAGSPVKFADDCREVAGRTLTFFAASDKFTIDGNQEQRTQTKGGSKCAEPPIH